MKNFCIMMMILICLIFINLNHPLSMGLTLLIQTTLMSFLISLMNESYWFSYILFLVFMGGLLILFIYVTSLASNEKFNFKINFYILFIMNLLFIFLIMYDKMILNEFFMNSNLMINKENFIYLIKLFNFPSNLITIMLMNYLLITLIAIVKITNIFYGPLRQMFN